MDEPRYSYPARLLAAVARDILFLRHRDFHRDATTCLRGLKPPLQIIGKENIPSQGPCVITVNHYHRSGFGAQWFTLAIAAAVPVNIHWVITGEFTYPGKWYESFLSFVSRILLKRIADIYGFSNMPPMPPRPQDLEARARAVRGVLEYVVHTKDPVVGLAPEGHDDPSGVLTRPAAGAGRFALLLAKAGLRFVPVGAYESEGAFHIHFGEPYELRVQHVLSPDEKDTHAAGLMMEHIACLLPLHLRGECA